VLSLYCSYNLSEAKHSLLVKGIKKFFEFVYAASFYDGQVNLKTQKNLILAFNLTKIGNFFVHGSKPLLSKLL
jgi:hypothetical protein